MDANHPHDRLFLDCGCRLFCDSCGHEEIVVPEDGSEPYCGDCAADGWSGELCHPAPGSCHMGGGAHRANEWERGFMCATHQTEHEIFCRDALAEVSL